MMHGGHIGEKTEIWVRADSKDDAVDFVEKRLAGEGRDLIDHRTYDVTNPPGVTGGYESGQDFIGSGKSAYRMSIVSRKGHTSQRRLKL
jgi:hypothetical protein